MPTFRVVLQTASPTDQPNCQYDTLVHVSDEESAAGGHVKRAMRHAFILGYSGPHLIQEARDLSQLPIREIGTTPVAAALQRRLETLLELECGSRLLAERPGGQRRCRPHPQGLR